MSCPHHPGPGACHDCAAARVAHAHYVKTGDPYYVPPRPGTDIARTTDPETSKAAAEAITVSGARLTQKQRVINAALEHPGAIRRELAGYTKMTEYQVSKRLSDVVTEGQLVYGDPRDGQQTVWPVQQAPLV